MPENQHHDNDLFEPEVDIDFEAGTAEQDTRRPGPPVAVLVGSTKFKEYFEKAARELSLQGYITLLPGVWHHQEPGMVDDDDRANLDRLAIAKIDIADVVMVVNPTDYIGNSTLTQISYANSLSIPVLYTNPPTGQLATIQLP